MAQRNLRYEFRLTEEEKAMLAVKAKQAGLKKSDFIRRAISEKEVKPAGSGDVMVLIQEIRMLKDALLQLNLDSSANGKLDVTRANTIIHNAESTIDSIVRVYSEVR